MSNQMFASVDFMQIINSPSAMGGMIGQGIASAICAGVKGGQDAVSAVVQTVGTKAAEHGQGLY